MKTPFLDQLIEEHQNHIESVEVSSYAGIPKTRKQLAELEAIKAIIVNIVSHRRELLIGLLTKLENGGGSAFIDKEQIVDDYLEANNCG